MVSSIMILLFAISKVYFTKDLTLSIESSIPAKPSDLLIGASGSLMVATEPELMVLHIPVECCLFLT